jgi:hypothetical protein
MFELQHFITDIIGSLQITDVLHFLIPQAGVGGGVEAREYVELLPLIKSTLIFLVGVGTVFGIGCACTRTLRRMRVRRLRTVCRGSSHKT